MATKKTESEIQGTEKEFLELFRKLCNFRSSWQVWADLMSAIACSLSNAGETNPKRRAEREKEYEDCVKRLGGSNEIPSMIFAVITIALEKNPDQDFLGKMYMQLELGNHWKGQFFTPYNICRCMAEMNIGPGVEAEVERRGYLSVADPACGAGAMLVAAANVFKKHGINYQKNVIFVAQDIDRVVAQMCYIQLSLLGCAGYVVVADSISNPVTGPPIEPVEKESQEFWYTPFYKTDTWQLRRLFNRLNSLTPKTAPEAKKSEENKFMFFFNFDKDKEVLK